MLKDFNPNRYSVIDEKNKREIVMLIGSGCKWKKCKFCDYHFDCDESEDICFALNKSVLENVTGVHKKLEVINSGSFTELDKNTINLIEKIAIEKNISEVHFECHYLFRKNIPPMRERFKKNNISLKIKCGVETFDTVYREEILSKGMKDATPSDIAQYFDEVCLLFGLNNQTEESMRYDIKTGLEYFERICINIMQENGCEVKPNENTIETFVQKILPEIKDDCRIDILLENTAFGVGGVTT